MLAGSLTEL
ncbi:hypothetical protein YPPY11_3951, partial [Yersinia pestis PY-11]